jgi:hypothetical protein
MTVVPSRLRCWLAVRSSGDKMVPDVPSLAGQTLRIVTPTPRVKHHRYRALRVVAMRTCVDYADVLDETLGDF